LGNGSGNETKVQVISVTTSNPYQSSQSHDRDGREMALSVNISVLINSSILCLDVKNML